MMAALEIGQTGQAMITIAVVLAMFVLFLRETYPTEVVAMTGAGVLLGLGVLPYDQALTVLSACAARKLSRANTRTANAIFTNLLTVNGPTPTCMRC